MSQSMFDCYTLQDLKPELDNFNKKKTNNVTKKSKNSLK